MRSIIVLRIGIVVLLAGTASARQDPLQGRWEGMVRAPQGERRATVTFKREGDSYTGAISGVGGTTEVPFKEIKVDGDKVSAKVQIEAPQGSVVVNFDFVLKGETLEGKGELNLGTQTLAFTYEMKRVGDLIVKEVPPEQKLEYFVGQWNFETTGRESPLGPGGSVKGTMSFRRVLDGRFLESRIEGKGDGVSLGSVGYVGYDAADKVYTFFESQSSGVAMLSTARWTGPGIRMETVPMQVKGQQVRLRRAISIVSESTFTLKEEISLDGGPFQHLASGTFIKAPNEPGATKPQPN